MITFSSLGLSDPILSNLRTEGYETPTPVQEQSIPLVLQGKDLLSCAQTGTGKTAAFGLPLLQLLSKSHQKHDKSIKALILCPTRELAIQIFDSFKAYGKQLPLKSRVIFGGVSQNKQERELNDGCDILIATPGRLLDLIQQKILSISSIQYLVLDEADRMLDMGFLNDIKKVLRLIPQQRQTLFFSATMPPEIKSLADSILNKPEYVSVTPVSTTAERIEQKVYFVEKEDKKTLLIQLLQEQNKPACLVFTRTKHGANRLVKDLLKAKIQADAIHGNKSQNARQKALSDFKSGKISVLIATDIAARGIDIDMLPLVINYELPNVPETYVHRIGRTGRAGASGLAISLCDDEEKSYLKDIQKLIKLEIPFRLFGNAKAPISSGKPRTDAKNVSVKHHSKSPSSNFNSSRSSTHHPSNNSVNPERPEKSRNRRNRHRRPAKPAFN